MSSIHQIRRALQVHTRYREAGGEDQVVEAEKQLLEQAGIEVHQVLFDNAELSEGRSLAGDLSIATSAVWSRTAQRSVLAAVAAHRPQVMHVHNTFAAASPSIYSPATRWRVPIVQTLHNYRLICPAATLFRAGRPCTDCVGRMPWPAVVHSCVRGSRAQSAVASLAISVHRTMDTLSRQIHMYIAMTNFQRQQMVAGGLPVDRIRVIPNFLEPDPGPGSGNRSGIVFVGRLSEEKGVAPLLEAAKIEPGVVRVGGRGPLQADAQRASAAGHIEYLGPLDRAAVFDQMRSAAAVVAPSICFETFGLVVMEAFASETPVIASRIGALAELVEDGVTGILSPPGDAGALATRIRWALDHPEDMKTMGANARRRYQAQFRGPKHLVALLDAYGAARRAVGRAGG